jgi:hypothetical protein
MSGAAQFSTLRRASISTNLTEQPSVLVKAVATIVEKKLETSLALPAATAQRLYRGGGEIVRMLCLTEDTFRRTRK